MEILNYLRSNIVMFFMSCDNLSFSNPDNRRECSVRRHNEVHDIYDKVMDKLGDVKEYVSRTYVYDLIRKETGLSVRHISRILNHTKKKNLNL